MQRIVEVRFILPAINNTLICCDGASRGNPGVAGYGFVCRSDQGEFIYAEAKGLGIATNFIVEVMAIVGAAECVLINNKVNICIHSDSSAAVKVYTSGKLPWFIMTRWKRIKELLRNIQFVHSLREINFSADSLAKRGAGLERGVSQIFTTRPNFLSAMESPDRVYYRFR
ncbi:uncharacterized protein LOC113311933 [Papaver somniferum]|uniref:uncharacterized protein LOC113311933 n=1 Tax=Papaver somniferum TaxID=3469 RepID=UPI000E6F7DCF|nr:uncharacterized protein LOC113311933 [Papaver somniferum]